MEKVYSGRRLDQISYPMGGIGAGMVCLEGTGRIASISLHNRPNIYNEPNIFAAVTVKLCVSAASQKYRSCKSSI